jgi:hypothetical protein
MVQCDSRYGKSIAASKLHFQALATGQTKHNKVLYSRIRDAEEFIFDSNPSTLRHFTERQ